MKKKLIISVAITLGIMILIGILGSVYYFGYYKPLRAELIEKARQLEEIDSRMYYNPNGENRSVKIVSSRFRTFKEKS